MYRVYQICSLRAISLSYVEISFLINVDNLFLRCIQYLEDFTSEGVLIKASFLQHLLNVSQLSEVELSFSVESIIVHFQFFNLSFELGITNIHLASKLFRSCLRGWGHINIVGCIALSTVDFARSSLHALSIRFTRWLWRSYFVSSHNVKHLLTLSALNCVIWFSGVVQVEITFDPLTEF